MGHMAINLGYNYLQGILRNYELGCLMVQQKEGVLRIYELGCFMEHGT